ncbi:MAG: winged helix-turn-helix domain-containing protein [Archaeoglobaceae archaeon]
MVRRSRWEIVFEILECVERGIKGKSRLMHATNLDWRIFSRYISYLEKENYLVYNDGYEITEKGRELLRKLREIQKIAV